MRNTVGRTEGRTRTLNEEAGRTQGLDLRVLRLERTVKGILTEDLPSVKRRLEVLEDTERQKNLTEISGLRDELSALRDALQDAVRTPA